MGDLGPKIRVSVRVRPRPAPPGGEKPLPYVKGQFGHYEFDSVLDEGATQQDAYLHLVDPLVQSCFQGLDGVLAAYGPALAGKSHTLYGLKGGGAQGEGMIQRAVRAIFDHMSRLPGQDFSIQVSHTALTAGHDAHLVDLLAPGAAPISIRDSRAAAALDEPTTFKIDSMQDLADALRMANVSRQLAAENSDLSARIRTDDGMHTALTISLSHRGSGGQRSEARLTFVELAAPEPREPTINDPLRTQPQTRNKAVAFQTLSAVVKGLNDAGIRAKREASGARAQLSHIPWRDAPLTVWLKDRLFSAATIQVLACVSGSSVHAADTLAALAFTSRIRPTSSGKGVLVTPTWGDAGRTGVAQADGADDYLAYRLTAGAPSSPAPASMNKSFYEVDVAPPPSATPARRALVPRDMDTSQVSMTMGSPGMVSPGAKQLLSHAVELDMERYSELMGIIRNSNIQSSHQLRAQGILQKIVDDQGELRRGFQAQKSENKVLKKQLQQLSLRLESENARSGDAVYMVDSLRGEQDRLMQQQASALEATMAEIEMLKQHIRTVEVEREKAAEEAARDRRAADEAEHALSEAKRQNTMTESRLRRLEDEVEEMRMAAESLRQDLAKAGAEAASMQARVIEREQLYEEERSASSILRSRLEESEASLRVSKREVERLRPMEAELHQLTAELREARSAVKALATERQGLASIKAATEERLTVVSSEYERVLMERDEEQQRLRGEAASLADSLRSEMGLANNTIRSLNDRIKALERDIDNARQAGVLLEQKGAEKDDQISKLRTKEIRLEQQVAEMQSQVADLESTVTRLENRVTRLQSDLAQTEAHRDRLGSDLDETRQQVAELSAEKADMGVEVSKLSRRLATAEGEAKDLRRNLESERDMRVDAQDRVKELSAELSLSQGQCTSLEGRVEQLETLVADVRAHSARKEAELKALEERCENLTRDLRAAGAALAEKTEQADRLQADLDDTLERLEARTGECQRAKEATQEAVVEAQEAQAAADATRRSLEEKLRAHRRLVAEAAMLLGVQGVNVTSDFGSPVVAEHILRVLRETASKARKAGGSPGAAAGGALGAPGASHALRDMADRLSSAMTEIDGLRSARSAADRDLAEAERKAAEWRRRIVELEGDLAAATSEKTRAKALAASEETDDLRRRVQELVAANRSLEFKLKLAEESGHVSASPGRTASPSVVAHKERQLAALERELEAMRKDRDAVRERSEARAREALKLKVELESLQHQARQDQARMQHMAQEVDRLQAQKDDAVASRLSLEALKAREALDSMVTASRARARAGDVSISFAGATPQRALPFSDTPGAGGGVGTPGRSFFTATTPSRRS
ncbi:unnamed protein product [Pedinophyceae sp. YPF-701]|nr:unnamed protein product [Pedinophyceae sp. YPF-701]